MKIYSKKIMTSIRIATSIISLLLIFVAGAFHSNTFLEKVASYATDVVKNNTLNQKYCCLTVSKTNESGPLLDSITEFHNLYGVFKQRKITYASSVNSDKSRDICFSFNLNDNLSALYVGPIGTEKYNGHFKHYILPIEVMFEDENCYSISPYIAYLSQSQADVLLELRGASKQQDGTFSEESYYSLIKTIVPILVDGQSFDFVIQNVYYQSNYFYEGLSDVMGSFIMTSYYFPYNLITERCSMYFMSEYTYQNAFFMKYINETYPSKKYDLRLNDYNIVGGINEQYLLSFYYGGISSSNYGISIFLLILSIAFLFLSLFMLLIQVFIFKQKQSAKQILFFFLSLLCPYFLFAIIYKATDNIVFLSEFSCKINFYFIIGYLFLMILFYFLQFYSSNKANNKNDSEQYEINI